MYTTSAFFKGTKDSVALKFSKGLQLVGVTYTLTLTTL